MDIWTKEGTGRKEGKGGWGMKEQGERGRGCEGKRIIRIERGDEKK